MPIKAVIFICIFLPWVFSSIFIPYLGVYGYISDYLIGTATQWWAKPFQAMGMRFSLIISVVTMVGMILQWRKLKFGKNILYNQEFLMLLFLVVVWFLSFVGEDTIGKYTTTDHPKIKLMKIIVFSMMMTHLVTDKGKVSGLMWVFVIGSFYLGIEAWNLPYRAFVGGRLEGIGGADFSDSNRFGGFMAGMLFIIGSQFLRSGWKGKIICFLSGGFTANAVILTRSRGAMLAVVAGMILLLITTPKKYRLGIIAALILAGAGVYSLTDTISLERTATVTATAEERDQSAQSRLDIWAGGYKMFKDNLLFGVGPGNFHQSIGRYQPLHPGRDAHNTIIRCMGELGLGGLILFGFIVVNALIMYYNLIRLSIIYQDKIHKNFLWLSIGFLCCLGAMFTYGMTGTLLYTEYFWWLLAIPVCLQRSYDNAMLDAFNNR